jgi:hypothetical protein
MNYEAHNFVGFFLSAIFKKSLAKKFFSFQSLKKASPKKIAFFKVQKKPRQKKSKQINEIWGGARLTLVRACVSE